MSGRIPPGQIELGIPIDHRSLLTALGRLAVAHGNLEMVQIMCLKSLKRISPEQAIAEFRRKGAPHVRKIIKK